MVGKISFSQAVIAQPPYTPLLTWAEDGMMMLRLNFQNYMMLAEDSLYWSAYLNSLRIAAIGTAACLVLGYPMAYAIAKAKAEWRVPLLMLIILPFWTSFLIRVYAWIGILKNNGLLNNFLIWRPDRRALPLMHTRFFRCWWGSSIPICRSWFCRCYATLSRMDESLLSKPPPTWAAVRASRFLTITLPPFHAGVVRGRCWCSSPRREFVIPESSWRPNTLMIGKVLWTEFFRQQGLAGGLGGGGGDPAVAGGAGSCGSRRRRKESAKKAEERL